MILPELFCAYESSSYLSVKSKDHFFFSLSNVCFVQKTYKETDDKKLDKMFSGLGRS